MADLFAPPTKEEIDATQNFGVMDYASDWGQSLLGGPRRGLESIPGTGGDFYDLLNSISSYVGGATEEDQKKLFAETDKDRLLPNSPEIEAATEQAYPFLGEHYQPKTRVGTFLNNLGATITGGGGRHFVRDALAPAAGGTIGAEVGQAVGGDIGGQFGSLIGGGATSSLQEGGKRLLMPGADPVVQRQIRNLQDPGPDPNNPLTPVELTGGQALDSPTLKYMEAGPFSNKAAGIGEQQARQFTQRALELAGIRGSDRADFNTMGQAQDQLSAQYEAMARANNGVVMSDPMLQQQLIDAGEAYARVKGDDPNSVVNRYFNRIADASQQHGGVIPPDVFQVIHSEMAADMKRIRSSPELAQEGLALRDMEAALFDSFGRSNNPQVQAQAQALNRQYRNFKILEDAMYSTSTDASRGTITPAALAQAVKRSESKAGFTQGRSDFADMSNAGSGLMKEIGNTGSGGRTAAAAIGGGIAGGTGMLLAGQPMAGLGAIGTAIGAPIASAGISAGLTSRPVRTSIVNRALGDAPSMWTPLPIAAATPALWQAGRSDAPPPDTEPSGLGKLLRTLGLFGSQMSMPIDAPVPVEPAPAPDSQSMNFDMPVPVDDIAGLIDPRARNILRLRGLG